VVSLAINQHMRLFPKIEVDVRDVLSGHQSQALLTRIIDVGFSHGPATSLELASEKLFKESLSVVLARSNPLAKRTHLRLKDLSHETLLLIERSISPHFHDLALALCRDAGLSLRIVLTESTVYDEAGAMMAASGKGVVLAVGKNPSHPSFADRLVALPLREPLATLEVHVAWRRVNPPRPFSTSSIRRGLCCNAHHGSSTCGISRASPGQRRRPRSGG